MKIYVPELGSYVEIPDKIERIVSLAPSVTDTLYMLSVWDRVVGVSAYCLKPPEAKKKVKVGSYLGVNFHLLSRLKPDIVFVTTGVQKNVLDKIRDKGFLVYPLPLPHSVYGIIENVVRASLVLRVYNKGRELSIKLLRQLAMLAEAPSKRPRVYVEMNLGGPVTVGAASYVDNFLYMIGAKNIFSDIPHSYFTPEFDEVIVRDPDIIIFEPDPMLKEDSEKFNELIKERGWENMKAVRDNKIIITPGDYIAHYGPTLITDILPDIKSRIFNLFKKG